MMEGIMACNKEIYLIASKGQLKIPAGATVPPETQEKSPYSISEMTAHMGTASVVRFPVQVQFPACAVCH